MIRRAVSLALGVVITAAALYYLLTPEVARELKRVVAIADWRQLILAMLLSGGIQWLRAWRFQIMTDGGLAFPGARLVRIAFQLNFLNFVLPFRLGELGYPVMMNRAFGQPLLGAAGVLLLVRLFDLCTVAAILFATGGMIGLASVGRSAPLLWLIAAAFAVAPVALVLATHAMRPLVARLPERRLRATIERALKALSPRTAQFAAIALSFAIWLVFGGLAALAADAVTKSIPVKVALLGASAGNLAFALPINGIGGLGPSQAAWVAAVSQAGIAWNDAVVSAFALYAVTLGSALLFGGLAMLGGKRR